jgi:hypothetical protein
MRRGSKLVSAMLGAVLGLGCAHNATSSKSTPASTRSTTTAKDAAANPAASRVKLAVLPVDSYAFPDLADWLSSLLGDARVNGVDEYVHSKVSLEVVQLAIECVDPTSACYSAVGRSLSANRLLLAQIAGDGRKHHKNVHVTVTVFDVDSGKPMSAADKVFRNEQQALADVEDLVEKAVKGMR